MSHIALVSVYESVRDQCVPGMSNPDEAFKSCCLISKLADAFKSQLVISLLNNDFHIQGPNKMKKRCLSYSNSNQGEGPKLSLCRERSASHISGWKISYMFERKWITSVEPRKMLRRTQNLSVSAVSAGTGRVFAHALRFFTLTISVILLTQLSVVTRILVGS